MSLPPVVAVEIGTSRVRAVVGEMQEDGHPMITGFGECPSRGVRKGEINHVENAESCVKTALQMAEENARARIYQVHLLVSGGHIASLVNRGSVPVTDPEGEVQEDDVQHAMEHARAVSLGPDRQVLHTVCQHFYVDDHEGTLDPVGMQGGKLAVDMLVIHGLANRMRNLVKVVRAAEVEVEDVAFSGLCSALAALTPEEKESGAVVLDLGGGTTDILVYAHGVIASAGCFAVGGDHLTNDIARGLRLSQAEAEQLKENEGNAIVDLAARSQKVTLPGEAGAAPRTVKLSDLHTIIHARMDELLAMVRSFLENQNLLHALGGGVVLTGGGAGLKNVTRLCERVLGLPCRIGCPIGLSGLAAVTESPSFAATAGMIRYAFKTRPPEGGLGDKIKDWFKGMFGK